MTTPRDIFVQLMQEHKGIIYKVARAYADSNEMEDLAQEIVYNLWKSYQSYKAEYRFTTWMYRVALNVAISYYKKSNKHKVDQLISEPFLIYEDNIEVARELETQYQQMFAMIRQLREFDRSIMLLYLENRPYREIAEIMGISESNVATRMNRIRDKMKSAVKTNNPDAQNMRGRAS